MRKLGLHADSAPPEPKLPEKRRTRSLGRRRRREREPEGFGEAVGAAALMLGLVTSAAFVGFSFHRYTLKSAHAYAVSLIERMAIDGEDAAMPPWSGSGRGPGTPTAKATFEAVRQLGGFSPHDAGTCKIASSFAVCTGTRYRCQVSGATPAGPLQAVVGLCDDGRGTAWSIDLVDVTVPTGLDGGNRTQVDAYRDGPIQYGDTPPAPESVGTKIRGLRLVRPAGR